MSAGFHEAKGYRPDIDGLRAIAVCLVVAFHAFPEYLPGGFIGVDVFFVISGFLITSLILGRLDAGAFSFADFYGRRARRILPALAVVLVVTLAIGMATLWLEDLQRLGTHALASAFFVPNLVFWNEIGYFDVGAAKKPLLHLWSLGVEEQFYLIWPVLLFVLGSRPRRLVPFLSLIVAASISYSVYATYRDPGAAFYSPFSRLWELGVGGLLASWRPALPMRRELSFAGLALIVGSALLLSGSSRFPGLLAIAPVAGAALVIAAGAPALAWRPLVWLGLISYPVYLWHWPLLSFVTIGKVATPGMRLLIAAASVPLAWLTFRLVEHPIRFGQLRKWGAAIGLGGTAVAAGLAAFVYTSEQGLWRYPPEIRPVLKISRFDYRDGSRFGRCWLLDTLDPFGTECRSRSVVVWGDSHAARLFPGLEANLGGVGQFTRSSCLPILRKDADPCAVGNLQVMEEIRRARPGRVIVMAAWLNYTIHDRLDANWAFADDLRKTLREVRAAGVADVVLVGPFPVFQPFLPEAVYQYWSRQGHLPDRLAPALKQYEATDSFLAAIAAGEGARFLSLYSALCHAGECVTHTPGADDDLLTWDSGHLTTSGATYVARLLELDRAPVVLEVSDDLRKDAHR
ncbi:MAG: acyltransferase [Betaproteobacteria bacterium]|nr:acyltransferase [Betaproteobacteria bacterium]